MRILFDNGTPRLLRRQLFGHDIERAKERGWDTLSNGVLLDRAEEAGFEVLITTDQGIRYQQNLSNRRVAVVVLMNTSRRPSVHPSHHFGRLHRTPSDPSALLHPQ